MELVRPRPPAALCEYGNEFAPAPDVEQWLRETFVNPKSPLYNKEHDHLPFATIGCLWTNVPNEKEGLETVGTAELLNITGKPWVKARQENQIKEWFGYVPDFLITLSAPVASKAPDAQWVATAHHELLHCGHKRDGMGGFKWTRQGPVFTMRPHDFENFYLIAELYGAEAAGLGQLRDILNRPPLITPEQIRYACGSCNARF